MNQYPENWREISLAAKLRANFTCQKCGDIFDPWNRVLLHVHHRDMNKANCDPQNLEVLCKSCHHELHQFFDPLWYPQPPFNNRERHELRSPVHIREVAKEILRLYLKIQRRSLGEVKP